MHSDRCLLSQLKARLVLQDVANMRDNPSVADPRKPIDHRIPHDAKFRRVLSGTGGFTFRHLVCLWLAIVPLEWLSDEGESSRPPLLDCGRGCQKRGTAH